MSRKHRNEQGISVRHARGCAAHDGGGCGCKPTFQAQAWDARAGKRLTKTFTTITAARQWRQDAGSALRAGTLSGARGPTVDEAVDAFMAAAKAGTALTSDGSPYKPSALRQYESSLSRWVQPALGRHRLGDLRLVDLQRWVDRLARDGLKPTRIASTVVPLRALYRRANQLGVVTNNPTRGLVLPTVRSRRETFATPAQAEAMLDVLDLPERALWATALYAGLRRGELAGLRWEDVDLSAGLIHVRRSWDPMAGEIEPKTRNSRRKVAIPAALRDHLAEQRALAAAANVLRVPSSRRAVRQSTLERRVKVHRLAAQGLGTREISEITGVHQRTVSVDLSKPLPESGAREVAGHDLVFTRDERVESIIKRGAKRIREAGLEVVLPHECRHTYASFLIAAGANAKTISAMMGHAKITTTFDLYGHLMPGAEDEAAGLLDTYLQQARAESGDELTAGLEDVLVEDK
jgi:integrase